MGDCKPIKTPLDAKTLLLKLSEEEYEEHLQKEEEIKYQEVVGLLMYAMVVIKQDLAFAISIGS